VLGEGAELAPRRRRRAGGKKAASSGCKGGGGGTTARGGEGSEGDVLHEWNRRNKKTLCATMVEGSQEKTTSLEPVTNSSIDDKPSVRSTNRKHRDEALDKTNAAVPSESSDDAQIKSNCSPELELSRTSASNFGSFRSKLGKGFRNSERARREDFSHIYI
jgi:hypothetical protein